MRLPRSSALALAVMTATSWTVSAFELKPSTLAAFERYVALTEARMAGEVSGASPFLWIDRQPEPARRKLLDQLKRGEVVIARLETLDGTREIDIKDGTAHHWVGTVLLAGVTLDRAIAFLQEYDRYAERFQPAISRSTLKSHTGDRFVAAMRTTTTKAGVTVVFDADYIIDYTRLPQAKRVWTRSIATNLVQVLSAGHPDEHTEPGDHARGYLWRLNNYCSFDERPEGTYEQCESVSLTASPPFGTGWIINIVAGSLPREALEFTLGRVRAALQR